MAFTTALSGLNAASNNLAVTGNNIANANTTGFKKSRSEFADVYAASIGGVSATTPGSGVRVTDVAQQFNQGTLEFTDNSLDLAISGEGFFTMASSPTDLESKTYTRAGEFKLDKNGFVVDNKGQALLVYRPNGSKVSDGFSTGVLQTVQLNAAQGLPSATTKVTMQVNFDAKSVDLSGTTFDPANSSTYTSQTSSTIFDTLGKSHIQTTYFVGGAISGGNRLVEVYNYIDGNPVDAAAPVTPVNGIGTPPVKGETLQFDSAGQLVGPIPAGGNLGEVQLATYTIPASSAAPLTVLMNYDNSTHLSAKFSVDALSQDGLPAGRLTGVDIDDEGVIFARFSNGGSKTLGKVALTRFPNPQGLAKLGDTLWGQSANSGEPIPGEAGANNFGVIQSGALEGSNVDLATQLVNLIVAQQSFQANSETISTEDTVIQTILNIR